MAGILTGWIILCVLILLFWIGAPGNAPDTAPSVDPFEVLSDDDQLERLEEVYKDLWRERYNREMPSDVPLISPYNVFLLFVVGSLVISIAVLLILRRKVKVKLSSNIPASVSIDGDNSMTLNARDVYEVRLRKGEYLFDFEDRNDSSRHKTFCEEVRSGRSKLIYAEFDTVKSPAEKTIKCFIAGSKSLQRERDALRSEIGILHNKFMGKNVRILAYTFEDFEKAAVKGGHQAQYNRFIAEEADWAVFIIDGSIGGVTREEYEEAMKSFKEKGAPKILSLNRIGSGDTNEEIAALRAEINKERQYWVDYGSIDAMKLEFGNILTWDLIEMN